METTAPLNFALIGCGRMGAHHARTLAQLPGVRLAGCFDSRPQAAAALAEKYATRTFASLAELIDHAAAAVIAVPTAQHLEIAEPLLRAGIPCLIEKPLAPDPQSAQRFVDLAAQTRTPLQVGHIERFNPAFLALAKLHLRPAFLQAVRISPHPFRSLDVGVVLDMMIHDIDIALVLAASPVVQCQALGLSISGSAEDACTARLTFANGCVADLTASRLALTTQRTLRLFSRDAYVWLDYQQRTASIIHRDKNLPALRQTIDRLRRGDTMDPPPDYRTLVQPEALPIESTDPLRAQAESFLRVVRGEIPPPVSAQDGLAAVALAHRILAAMPPTII